MAIAERKLEIYEVIEKAVRKRSNALKVEYLKENESWALKDVLRGFYDSSVKWNLPSGHPPYEQSDPHNHPASLRRENRQFKWLVEGGPGDKMPAFKRENIFIGMLEAIHPADSDLLLQMISKQKIDGLSRAVIEEAFPGLLKDDPKK